MQSSKRGFFEAFRKVRAVTYDGKYVSDKWPVLWR